ncbi:dihydrodipicolinate reductase C-terminal domain-containing protein [Mollicutes bacterium LVI A0039]|nr:dihydrodipicolinate reductase C-terminal domain-containing protein [Mollicutes bacterium LVI A0039]
MQIVIHGSGKMAEVIMQLVADSSHLVVAVIDPKQTRLAEVDAEYDLVIDFSHHLAIDNLITDLAINPHPAIIATTGLSDEQKQAIAELSNNIPVYQDYNTSYGIAVMCQLVSLANGMLNAEYDRTLIDRHHCMKVDSPSGTSFKLANYIDGELAVNSIRAGGIFGEHTLTFTSSAEEITISHTAFNREVFAAGALKIADKLVDLANGLYNIESIYGGE